VSVVILHGHAARLPLPGASVDLIVTSPPFYQLRDYRDGDESLAGQIGGEATPAEYIEHLLECTAEWMRVLKPSGSIFVNLGDKYSQRTQVRRSAHQPGIFPGKFPEFGESWAERAAKGATRMPHQNVISDDGGYVAEKSLMDLPHRYSIACEDQLGLIKRAEIVWAKVNGLPESVTDRVRRSHEMIFHFTVQPRYYAAVDEIREPHLKQNWDNRSSYAPGSASGSIAADGTHHKKSDAGLPLNPLGKLPGSVWDIPAQPLNVPAHLGLAHFAAFPMELPRRIIEGWSPPGICAECGEGRRPVSVTEIDRSRPPARQRILPPKVTLSGNGTNSRSSQTWGHWTKHAITGYACACTPYTDHPGTGRPYGGIRHSGGARGPNTGSVDYHIGDKPERTGPWREYHLDRWQPPPARPAIVLDPFGGTGTSALVADVLGRTGITVDLSAGYCRLARWRTTDPGERARAMQVPKPPPVPEGQDTLFDL
jgi:DNA modification methylase